MNGWRISHALYFVAIIVTIIGAIVGIGVGSKSGTDLNENDRHNTTRANFFFLAAIAVGVLAWLQMAYEKHGMMRHKM